MKTFKIGRKAYGWSLIGLGLMAGALHAAPITWNNTQGTFRWNVTEANFTGVAFAPGDAVTFGATGAGSVFIGEAGPVAADVAPASVTVSGGTYTFSGGDITSGSFSQSGTGNSSFTGYTNSLSFAGGATVSAGTLTFNPAEAGTYGFGKGALNVSGGSFKLGGPTNGVTTLTNALTLSGVTLLWDIATATTNAAVLSGPITLSGNPTLGNGHAYLPRRALKLTGEINMNGANRTISSWNEGNISTVPQILGQVNGQNTRSLSLGPNWTGRGILIGGNGGWSISNLNVGIEQCWVVGSPADTDFFSGVRANGGKVFVTEAQAPQPGVMHLRSGGFSFQDFSIQGKARMNVDLAGGDTVTVLGGQVTPSSQPNGLWVTPGAGILASNVTVGAGGVMRTMYVANSSGTSKFRGGDLSLLGGSTYEVATGTGDWNLQVRLTLQAQDEQARLVMGDGLSSTAETVTFRGVGNVVCANPVTAGFIVQVDQNRVADDGNLVLRYESPTSNILLLATSVTPPGTYNSSDRFVVGWSGRTNATVQYAFRGGSAGTEFAPYVASIDALGPQAGVVFTNTSPATLLANGTVGFYNSDASMNRGTIGPVQMNAGGSLVSVSNGTFAMSVLSVYGGTVGGVGSVSATGVVVHAAASLDPGVGARAGILKLTNAATCKLSVLAPAVLTVDVVGENGAAGTDYDRLAVYGAVAGLDNLDLVVRFARPKMGGLAGQDLVILTAATDFTGQSFRSVQLENGYRCSIVYGNGQIVLRDVRYPGGTLIQVR